MTALSKKDKCLPSRSPPSTPILHYLSPFNDAHLFSVILYIMGPPTYCLQSACVPPHYIMQLAAVLVHHALLQNFHNNLGCYFNFFHLRHANWFATTGLVLCHKKFVEPCSTSSFHLALVLLFGRFITSYIYFEIRCACSFALRNVHTCTLWPVYEGNLHLITYCM